MPYKWLVTALLLGSAYAQQPLCHSKIQVPACGTALATWPLPPLQNGQPAFSNGIYQGTECSCEGNLEESPYYQCVEYVKRYYEDALGVTAAKQWTGDADAYYNTAAKKGLLAFPQGGNIPPAPNDILVFQGGGAGHVAIVESVSASGSCSVTPSPHCGNPTNMPCSITLIEQNWSPSGTCSLELAEGMNGSFTVASRGTCDNPADRSCYTVQGWLRSPTSPPFNPVPTILSLIPNSLPVGSQAQPLNIIGTGLLSMSSVTFNGALHNATLSGGSLIVQLSSTDLANSGSFPVIVTNPPPGGGSSNTADFIVGNPVPSITSLSPSSLPVGSSPQPLTVNGAGFVASSTVNYNDQNRSTTFVSNTVLTIQLTSADLATPGSYPVYVTNPAPLGGNSNTVDFMVSGQSEVTISPSAVTVPEAGLQTFSATVSIGGGVTWSVQEGSAGGTITSAGIYTPPNSTGIFHVIATSIQAPSQYAIATVTVVPPVPLTVLYAFPSGTGNGQNSGDSPQGELFQANDGLIFGTTLGGGNFQNYGLYWNCFNEGCGTIFETDTAGNLTPLHLFVATDGALPNAGVISGADGFLYGTVYGGGPNHVCVFNGGVSGCGAIFKIDTAGNFTLLHSFQGTDGAFPEGSLVKSSDGFYSTTSGGGDPSSCTFNQTPGCGTIFRVDTSGNLSTLHLFHNSDGAQPTAGLVRGADGTFYGTTSAGGSYSLGTVFSLNAQGTFSTLHEFQDSDGSTPYSGLLLASDGNLYGMTWAGGGSEQAGVIFRINASGAFTVLHAFSSVDGSNPDQAPLIEGAGGFLYGTTLRGGTYNEGTVFKMDLTGNVTVLHSFSGSDGSGPNAPLLIGADGYLYGSTLFGNSNEIGVIYRLSDSTSNEKHLHK